MTNPHLTEGNNHFRNNKYKEAIEAYSKIDKSNTSYPYALFNIGECYLQQQKLTKAFLAYSNVNDNHNLFTKAQSKLLDLDSDLITYIEKINFNFNIPYTKESSVLIAYLDETNFDIPCTGENMDISE